MDDRPLTGPGSDRAEPSEFLVAPIEISASPPVPPTVEPPRLASLGDRLAALLVDGFVAGGVFVLVGMLVAAYIGGTSAAGFNLEGWPAVITMTGASVVVLVYLVFFELTFGATLGKLVAGVQVRTTEYRRLSGRAALLRNLFRVIDGQALYLIGAVFVLFTRRHQRLGDLAAGTMVVQRDWSRVVRGVALVLAVLLGAAGVAGGILLRPPTLVSEPRFTQVVLTDDQAVRVGKDVFAPATATFYIFFSVADVPENTTLRVVWYAEQVPNEQPNLRIDDAQVLAGGSQNQGQFSLSRTSFSWPPGTYRADLSIGREVARTVRFRVDPNAAPVTSPSPGAGPTSAPPAR